MNFQGSNDHLIVILEIVNCGFFFLLLLAGSVGPQSNCGYKISNFNDMMKTTHLIFYLLSCTMYSKKYRSYNYFIIIFLL